MHYKSRLEREADLRNWFEKAHSESVLLKQDVIAPNRALYVIGRPKSSAYRTEIAVLSWGTLLVHGDIDTVVFANYFNAKNPREVIAWMANASSGHAREKASIGSGGKIAQDVDLDIAVKDLLEIRRQGYISADCAREANAYLKNGDLEAAKRAIYEFSGDAELCDLGSVVDSRIFMAQAALQRLLFLLDTQGEKAA